MALVVASGACSDDGIEPEVAACEAETSSVEVEVTVGQGVVFDWSPACGVALVLVEEEASDQWGFGVSEELWGNPGEANVILPPLTYGTPPEGVEVFHAAEILQPGTEYELVLWRILPEGSDATCLTRLEDACLVAVHAFTR